VKWAKPTGQALLDTVAEIDPGRDECGCAKLRWRSVLT